MLGLGSHVSIRRGYKAAAETAAGMGATAFQYFPKNPRSLGVKPFNRADAERCAAFCREHGLRSIAHSPYPGNPAHEDRQRRELTAVSLRNDLEIAEACGSVGVVVHFGSCRSSDPLEGYRNVIATIDEVVGDWDGKALLLLENQAGDHGPMGMTLEELVQVRNLSGHPERVGLCLDTCHLFASGVWDGRPSAEWLDKARATGALQALAAVHLNESRHESGSRRDRHAPIGQGAIGDEGIAWLLGLPEVRAVPIVMETPEAGGATHRDQLARLRELAD